MQDEYDALKAQGTWIFVPPPWDRSVVGSKCVYKAKKIQMAALQGTKLD